MVVVVVVVVVVWAAGEDLGETEIKTLVETEEILKTEILEAAVDLVKTVLFHKNNQETRTGNRKNLETLNHQGISDHLDDSCLHLL